MSNRFAEIIIRNYKDEASLLDSNNIVWKVVNDEWIGKRSVWTLNNRACWLEDTLSDNVAKWWCGIDADYNEVFYRK